MILELPAMNKNHLHILQHTKHFTVLTYLILTISLSDRNYDFSHFRSEETETRGGRVTCERSQSCGKSGTTLNKVLLQNIFIITYDVASTVTSFIFYERRWVISKWYMLYEEVYDTVRAGWVMRETEILIFHSGFGVGFSRPKWRAGAFQGEECCEDRQRQGTFFRMAVIELKGVRGHEEGSGHYGKRREWNQNVDSLSFKAKKTVKLSSQHRETLSVGVVSGTRVDHQF